MSIRVQLQQFEGPLDLLLYLIRKDEMDIFNINVTEITKQYLEFIKLMKEFDIEVAGDFIAMASTLIQIKSRMLLPQYDENGEIVETEDPRKELVQKLLEYEKFKEAAKALYERPLLNRDQWARGLREKMDVADDEIELEDNALFSLIGSYRKMIKASLKRIHKVSIKLQSIGNRILEMKDLLIVGKQITMQELYNNSITEVKERSRNVLITFLSLLELGKMGYVSLYQTETYGDVYVNARKPIEGDVLSHVEEYGNINADQVAENLFHKSNVLTEEEIENIDAEQINFELQDGGANAQTEQLSFEQTFAANLVDGDNFSLSEELASDDEILAAEMEIDSADINLDLNLIKDFNEDMTELPEIAESVLEPTTPDLDAKEELTPEESVTAVEEFIAEEEAIVESEAGFEAAASEVPTLEEEYAIHHAVDKSVEDAISAAKKAASAFDNDEPINNEEYSADREVESEGQV